MSALCYNLPPVHRAHGTRSGMHGAGASEQARDTPRAGRRDKVETRREGPHAPWYVVGTAACYRKVPDGANKYYNSMLLLLTMIGVVILVCMT